MNDHGRRICGNIMVMKMYEIKYWSRGADGEEVREMKCLEIIESENY